jgi:hypothetical protein
VAILKRRQSENCLVKQKGRTDSSGSSRRPSASDNNRLSATIRTNTSSSGSGDASALKPPTSRGIAPWTAGITMNWMG